MTNSQQDRDALTELIDGQIPDDICGYRHWYTDRAVDAILDSKWLAVKLMEATETGRLAAQGPQVSTEGYADVATPWVKLRHGQKVQMRRSTGKIRSRLGVIDRAGIDTFRGPAEGYALMVSGAVYSSTNGWAAYAELPNA